MDGSNAVEIPVQVKLGVFSTMNSYVIYVNYRLQVKRNYFYIESTRCFFFSVWTNFHSLRKLHRIQMLVE